MNALEQRVEREAAVRRYREFAVEHEGACFERAERLDHFGKIAIERLSGFRLELHVRPVAEREAAEAVPFGFV